MNTIMTTLVLSFLVILLVIAGMSIGAREEYVYLHRTLDKHPPPEELLADTPLTLDATWRLGPMGFVWAALLSKAEQ